MERNKSCKILNSCSVYAISPDGGSNICEYSLITPQNPRSLAASVSFNDVEIITSLYDM